MFVISYRSQGGLCWVSLRPSLLAISNCPGLYRKASELLNSKNYPMTGIGYRLNNRK